jgi:hypothetical protein
MVGSAELDQIRTLDTKFSSTFVFPVVRLLVVLLRFCLQGLLLRIQGEVELGRSRNSKQVMLSESGRSAVSVSDVNNGFRLIWCNRSRGPRLK